VTSSTPSKPLFAITHCLEYRYRNAALAKDQCGNPVTPGNSGIFTFKDMVTAGFLDASGGPAEGINYRFDNCSQTVRAPPLLLNIQGNFIDPMFFE
jgi:hypothetical protein